MKYFIIDTFFHKEGVEIELIDDDDHFNNLSKCNTFDDMIPFIRPDDGILRCDPEPSYHW